MMRIRTARERVLLGILVLLVLLGGVIALASWRARSDGHERLDLTRRASVVAALQDARAQFLRGADLVATAVFVQDPAPVIDSYRQAMTVGDEALNQARDQLAQIDDTDTISALETFSLSLSSLRQDVEPMLASAISVDREARLQAIQEYPPKLWPRLDQLLADLDGLAIEQQAKLTAEQANANHASDVTLALLISSNVFAFVAGSAVLVFVFVWVIRPLAALRSSVKAIAAGDFQASAKVSGPEEVASLARDFNEMVARRGSMEEALRDSDERYRTLFNHSLDAVYVHDFEGRFVDANDAALQLLGYSHEEISNLSFTDLIDDSQLTTALAATDEIMKTGRQTRPNTFRLRRKDGAFVEMEVVAAVVQREGRPAVIQGIARDITERKQSEEALRESEAKYRRIFETVQDIFYHTDARGIITEISPSVGRWGYTREELIGTQVLDVYDDPEERSALLKTLVERGEVTDYEVHLRAADGEIVNASVGSHILRDSDGTVVGVEGFLRDIRERKKAEEALREQMRRDPLTGVLNHAAIVNELRSLIPTDGGGGSCAVLMSDVDDLKAINDTFGHQVGDSVLTTVADTLCRDGAVVGRYGGDEFVAILPGAGREAAERYRGDALNALEQVAMRDPQSGARVPVVVSIGLAIYPIESGRIEELIDLADSGMYGAKRQRPVGAASAIAPRPQHNGGSARIMGEIVPFLTSAGELNEKLRLVARRLSLAVGYDAVSFILYGSEPDAPPVMNTFARAPEHMLTKWNNEEIKRRLVPILPRRERRHSRPAIIDNLEQMPRFTDAQRDMIRKAGLRSALTAPMVWRNEPIGLLAVASRRENAFTPRDAQFLIAIATQVTAIVSMETLVKKLQSASGRLAQAHTETVMLLAAAAEAHDRTTGQHLRNVRTISEELAQELGWREEDAKELGLAAVLHDIGKIRVADSVLANTGRLTNEEWELMKHHAAWGEEFLAGRPGFELAAAIARSHHERWDGVGYPDGLSGEEIPDAAAIAAVADSFDAMTSGRPYKPGRPAAAAMKEIVACSGSQFSPRVVEAMVHLRKRRRLPHLRQRTLEEKAA